MQIRALLAKGGGRFHTIDRDAAVAQALKHMAAYSVSALVVMDQDRPCGIFTERDLVRCHLLFAEKEIGKIPVETVMTQSLVVVEPSDSVEDAMAMMIKAGIRHLPVVENKKIIAMIGLQGLVKAHVGALTQELHYLKDYISDLQDAAHD